jgi:hypothetical protein
MERGATGKENYRCMTADIDRMPVVVLDPGLQIFNAVFCDQLSGLGSRCFQLCFHLFNGSPNLGWCVQTVR